MNRILIVDDEALSLLFLSTALESEGFQVRTAANAEEALNAGAEFQPECLLSDWMLKDDRDGIFVARSLAKDNPALKIIFITGMDKSMLSQQAGDLRYDVLVKPLDIDQVVSLVKGQFSATAGTVSELTLPSAD